MEVFTARPSSGEIEEREWTYVRKDGSVLPVLLSVTASRDKHNAITGFMGIANDITQQRQAQQELREAREAAVQASRAKSEFLANMSHEIRTPMNGIIGMTELALVTKLSTDQREYLETIKESADSLLTVVNDILDFSKVEAGMLHLETIDFDLPAKLNAVIRALTTRAGEKGLELTCQFDPEVPTWVAGDPDRLRQVIVNLAGNAIKFTDGGEVSVGVRLQEAPVDGEKDCLLHFTVRDTGIGIPADKQRVIFDAFAQADSSTTRRFGGTGLGLTISARLVALMGGQIWVESTVGEGSTFHFTARFKVSDVATPVRAAEQLAALKDMRVLVVDDNATNRLVLHDMLVNWKMCPVLTASGREALSVAHAAAARGERFPLILVDYLMPEMDGVQLIELIHDSPSLAGAKIVLLTSVSDRLHTERCRQLNIAGFLRKPLNQSTLLDELLEAMSSHAADALAAAEGNSPCGADADKTETPAKAQPLDLLLVEDNRINQRVAMRMLDLQGHRVTLADSGARALAILEQHEFDGVLMDLQMPDMDGFETTAEIRRREAGGTRRLPIIAMTAHALKGDRERCLEAGMDGYVSKPVSAEELRRALASIQPKCVPAGEYDIADAIKRVDGDLEFLGQLAVMLEEDAPGALAGIGAAIESRNARQLERVAHQLKGSLAPFAAAAAIHSAQALENAGRDEEFVEAPAELDRLKLEVERLLSALANLRSASASTIIGGAGGETAKRQGDRSCTT
jgi:signal transduction histidine kinase/DNA-binding response OmpR family regulator